MQKLHHLIDLMAENADTTALLLGESGTGKELVAREIHRRSSRRERPFLDINCAVLSETLLESQMFGHERGAFTDARELKRGLLEVADGGTILLDEIGEMPVPVQPKLLRMLESRTLPQGGRNPRHPGQRAGHRGNQPGPGKGRGRGPFPRGPLLPPERVSHPSAAAAAAAQDIPVLAMHFLSLFNQTLKKSIQGFTPDALELMTGYRWPGNVRELKNIVERAAVLTKKQVVGAELLPREISGSGSRRQGRGGPPRKIQADTE